MKSARNNGFYHAMHLDERDAAMETIRQLLEQTERLASDAELTEVAFLIGVALASLRQEGPAGVDIDPSFGTSSQIM